MTVFLDLGSVYIQNLMSGDIAEVTFLTCGTHSD